MTGKKADPATIKTYTPDANKKPAPTQPAQIKPAPKRDKQ